MNHKIIEILERWLAEGRSLIGQIRIAANYELTHHLDAGLPGLKVFTGAEQAREIARYNEAGEFRPLKSKPDLRRGWKLALRDVEELHQALDFFYPAMIGTFMAYEQRRIDVTPLRETLNRQSGMYAITKKIAAPDAGEVTGRFCESERGCLKTILWPIEQGIPVTSLPADKFEPQANQTGVHEPCIPLLCTEACNLLVAEIRETVKRPGKEK